MEEEAVCPYCGLGFPTSSIAPHVEAHILQQNDEEYAKSLLLQDEQALSESAALMLVQNDVTKAQKLEEKSPLSAMITTPEQIAEASRKKDNKVKAVTAMDINPHFLAYVDNSHRPPPNYDKSEITHLVLFDIDNCGAIFEQIADPLVYKSILVYVFGGPGFPNVSNVKLPILAEMHQNKRLHIIPMTKKGKNAADFVLSFYGGILHERLPTAIPFIIVSRDKGLSQLAEHLGLLGRPSQLISSDIVKHLTTPVPQPTSIAVPQPTSPEKLFEVSQPTQPVQSTQPTQSPQHTQDSSEQFSLLPPTPTGENPFVESTQQTTVSSPPTTESQPTEQSATRDNDSLKLAVENPFVENPVEFTVEQAVWFVISGLSKVDTAQRPKTQSKLENSVSGLVKRIPGKRNHLTTFVLIQEMQKQNFIFLDGSKVVYLF